MTNRHVRAAAPLLLALLLTVVFVVAAQTPLTAVGKGRGLAAFANHMVGSFGLARTVMVTLALGVLGSLAAFPWRLQSAARQSSRERSAIPALESAPQRRTRVFGRAAVEGAEQADDETIGQSEWTPESRALAAEMLAGVIAAATPPPPHDGPLPPEIEAARWRPILFRRAPLDTQAGKLSFYGGRPFVPPGFLWPTTPGDGAGKPLHFIMQWDCRGLAALDATGLMPTDGVLYFFLDFEWGNQDGFRFIHHPGPTDGWGEAALPPALGPIMGDHGKNDDRGSTPHVENADAYVPRIMPRVAFDLVAMGYPVPDQQDDQERLFWDELPSTKAAQLAAQYQAGRPERIRHVDDPKPTPARPFAAFPHDFGAIRVIAAKALKEVCNTYGYSLETALAELPEAERDAQLAQWQAEARDLFGFAAEQACGSAVPQALSDQVWDWVERLGALRPYDYEGLGEDAVNRSLGYGSDALSRIPDDWLDKVAARHALASEYDHWENPPGPALVEEYRERKARGELPLVRTIHAPVPAHMFGPPSYVQGDIEDMIDANLLLLELPSHGAPGLSIGDGVLQYLIAPEDLRTRRWDRVKSVISGY